MLRSVAAPHQANGRSYAFELSLPSRPEWVAIARLVLAGIANNLDVPVDVLDDMKLAVSEACTYVMTRADSLLRVSFWVSAGVLSIRVAARGSIGMPPAGKGESAADLGAMLVRSLMDQVELRYNPPSNVTLTMHKALSR